MLAILLSFVITSAGFGVQYLMWPLPLALACATRRTWFFVWPATAYALLYYVHPSFVPALDTRAFGVYSIPVVIGAALALPIDQRFRAPARATADAAPSVLEPAAEPLPATADGRATR